MAVLVTGGAGFIGSHAAKLLQRSGFRTIVYDNLSRGHAWAAQDRELVVGDIANQQLLGDTLRHYQIDTVVHFAASAYVGESMTFERFMDVLCLLEMEVFKERRIWGPRKARVKVGEPVNLKDHASSYAANKRTVVQDVTLALESSVRQMLDALGADCKTVRDLTSDS